jgi:hypothetical protein
MRLRLRPLGSGSVLDERPPAALIPSGLAGKAGLRPQMRGLRHEASAPSNSPAAGAHDVAGFDATVG